MLGFLSCRRGWGVGNQGDFSAEFIKSDRALVARCISSRVAVLQDRAETLQSFAVQDEQLIQMISELNVEIFNLKRIEKRILTASVAADCHE